MKKLLAICAAFVGTLAIINGCTKVDPLPQYSEGKAVTLTPSTTTVVPTVADSNKTVLALAWTNPEYATDAKNYKFVIEIDSTDRNSARATKREVVGKMTDSITGRELNAMLLGFGFTLGSPYTLDIRVVSSYVNNNERYMSNTVKVTVTPYNDPSVFSSDKTTVNVSLANASQNALTFSWTPSFKGYAGVVTYTLQFDSAGVASLREMPVGASLFSKALTIGELNQTALDEGIAGGTTGKLEYRVKAVTAQGATSFSNAVAVTIGTYVPAYRFYIVGSMNGWNINSPWEIISDKAGNRWGKVFYTYAKLNAGDAFVFVKTPGDWNSKHGSTGGGTGGIYEIGAPNTGGDFTVSTSGIYRLTIDLNANKVYIQQKQVGVVGNMQSWNAGSPIFGGLLERDKFLIIAPSTGTDAFKFHEGPAWDNGSPDKARWWGRGASAGLLDNDGNGPDIVANSTPYTRAIWDGTDPQQLKYSLSAGQLRVVGGATVLGNWEPNNALNMTYQGNGVWTATFTLTASTPFKFVSSEGWSYNYGRTGGAASSGNLSLGGDDITRPAGTYTVTVNEYTQTYTIN